MRTRREATHHSLLRGPVQTAMTVRPIRRPAHRLHLPVVALLLSTAAACTGADSLSLGARPALSPPVDTAAYLADVTWLADDARRGRDTPSPELMETAHYVARAFEEAGLQPLGDRGGWFQHFEVLGQQRLIDGNMLQLSMTLPDLGGSSHSPGARDEIPELLRDWVPLQTALTGYVGGEVVFAGYGISDPEGGYDDYAEINARGKVVLVLRSGPNANEAGSRYAEGGERRGLIDFTSKVNTAFRNGAVALLVVNDPLRRRPGTRRDRLRRYGPLRGDGPTASLPAAHLTAELGEVIFSGHGLELATVQRGIDKSGRPHSFPLQGQTATIKIAAERSELPTVNVLGFLPGSDPTLANEHVLIGAHMDHLGTGEGGNATSRGGPEAVGQIHNGADDNASGTAGVIGLARWLGSLDERPRRGIVFATWSGEEWGLLGSRHYVEHPALPIDQLVTAMNMDMIGRSKDGYVIAEGTGSSPGFRDLIVQAHDALRLGLDLHLGDVPSSNSDHAPFFEAGVPVLNFFTGLHDEYHKPSDDIELINADGGARIASLAGSALLLIAEADERQVFAQPHVEPAEASPHATLTGNSAPDVQAYRVVLGTSPDMSYQRGDGVRLSSVRNNTPAQRAGLKGGDVIIALDGKTVRNLQDYSVLLFSHRPGDVITVTVRRDDEELELTATLTGQSDN